ncbi:hypothetical protein [Clostridium sp. M14]|uniref:hypothetical protein n=1 Tax=Clostridium sp. M14 TaxID=2716311 RepID=UPI001CCA191E|nr:hypothetical protein [Clostridium sp. M14]MBZ9692208.1 hypothetical protein [Clostridium sp. M14]
MEELIRRIKSLSIFNNVSYYVSHSNEPLWRNFSGAKWNGTPYYLKKLCTITESLIKELNITQEEIIKYIVQNNDNYFYVTYVILEYGVSKKINDSDKYAILDNKKSFPKDIVIQEDILSCAVVSFILDKDKYNKWDFNYIVSEEEFQYPTNDYKLTRVTDVTFKQRGFIYENKYYLYNIFINKMSISSLDEMPAVFNLLTQNIDLNNADLYLRIDERLAIPLQYANVNPIMYSERFRGFTFRFANTVLEKMKNIVVHYDPETFDKLLMVIKKDFDTILNQEFWHVELETLPYVDRNSSSKNIKTSFIHGKYYPKLHAFRHVDYIINQYPIKEYCDKHDDRSQGDIQIDYYTTKDCHYKIWCIENTKITEELWYKLVSVSLPEKYIQLFNEMLQIANNK